MNLSACEELPAHASVILQVKNGAGWRDLVIVRLAVARALAARTEGTSARAIPAAQSAWGTGGGDAPLLC